MYQLISDIIWKIVKPIGIRVLKKKGYPEDAILRKIGEIPGVCFTNEEKVIMFHGVSVGEAIALENLVKTAKQEFKDTKVVLTTGTYTGQEIAKKKLASCTDLITYFPADFPCVVKNFLDKVKPSVVFIAETEIWPNFAMECRKRGIKLYIINGRISDSTFKTYNALRFIFKYFLSFYSGIFTQSVDDNNKFLALGANLKTTKVMNNLKFDIEKPEKIDFDKGSYRVLLAGSTHQGEEQVILNSYRNLKNKFADLKLIIAPRHLTRVNEVISLIERYKFSYKLRSARNNNLEEADVFVLDTLGELGKMYAYSDVSFIGGSFNKTGGHNPLESIIFNKPVISGPSTHNFKDIYSIIKKSKAGFVVKNEDEFLLVLEKLFSNQDLYNKTVGFCERVMKEQQGALEFVLDVIKEELFL